jgi:hypothetical protein
METRFYIRNCSYSKWRQDFHRLKTHNVKLKGSTKIIFSKFSCEELNIFYNFKVK